ncbi:geranylgeranyl transferase type2 beta subunit [Plasmodium gonderi]|uniref:Geranylgeranyl transferase type II subunit beta n=1 Tax=Plasmodium gonderi TaxID=77519 RepID=A0A1Y1JPX3_PLAGO|nr:geranylgeranyl transferase type2 beta subunit [Plasmodium gonderi]GAW83525.1 geranylgeranyl transferase type2 beta subunit [Plasmodium gonderi]
MDLDLKLHENYFLNIIKEKLGNKYSENDVCSKYESIFLSGIFWVLSGLCMVKKNRMNLDEVLDKKIIDTLYKLVMQSLQKKKIKEKYIYKLKKEKYFLSNEDINRIVATSKCDPSYFNKNVSAMGNSSGGKIESENERISSNFFIEKSVHQIENINSRNESKTDNCNVVMSAVTEKMSNQKISSVESMNSKQTDSTQYVNKMEGKELKIIMNMTSLGKRKKKKFHLTGFSPCGKICLYEANVISTLSAIQILFLLNKISEDDISTNILLEIYNFLYFILDEEKGFYHFSLNSTRFHYDGDMRFMFCSLSVLYFINLLLKKRNIYMNLYNNNEKCAQWILTCFNLDGGFSNFPGSESHAGTTFCAINSLNMLRANSNGNYILDNVIVREKLIRWLCDRCDNLGINGRVGKEHDVCYAWWVLGSLVSLKTNLSELFNVNILINFILKCQDQQKGGFSRTENKDNYFKKKHFFNIYEKEMLSHQEVDLFHTFFALCALSLIYQNICYYKKKQRKKYKFFDDVVIPMHLESILNDMAKIHQFLAMPIHMTY